MWQHKVELYRHIRNLLAVFLSWLAGRTSRGKGDRSLGPSAWIEPFVRPSTYLDS